MSILGPALVLCALAAGCVQAEPATWSPSPPGPAQSAPAPTPPSSPEAAPPATTATSSSSATPATPSCPAGSSSRTIDEGPFSFQVPCELEKKPVQGIDSKVGHYEGGGMVLDFDHGWYSSDLREFDKAAGLSSQQVSISGKSARVITFKAADPASARPFGAAVYFAEVGAGPGGMKVKLTMVVEGTKAQDQITAKKIFQSIRFK